MFLIDFIDTTEERQELSRDVISWFDEKFLTDYNYEITIQSTELDVFALMHVSGELEEPREFHIEMDATQSDQEFIKSLLHELVHIEDYILGNLTEKECERSWKGILYEYEDYVDQPWEIRAEELENSYYEQYCSTRGLVCQVP